MEGIAMMVMTLPITFPLMIDVLGYNPIWFGVLLTILVECALITPPVGLNLYVISSIAKDTNMTRIIKGSLPFFLIILVGIALLTVFPDLVLFLPNQMLGD
jgi:TRAP-type C4-dicarboxylate transport system permease large subunit